MAKKPVVHEVFLIRALAMIGVIAVHGTSSTIVDLAGQSDVFWLYQTMNRFGKLGTPVFIFLSSFVLFYNYADRKLDGPLLKRFYSRRLLYIVIPYLVWSVFYYFMRQTYADQVYGNPFFTSIGWQDFFSKLMYGKAYTHLYFVIISIQFYVLFPLALWLLSRSKNLGKYAFWIGIGVQWAFYWTNNLWFSQFAREHGIEYYTGSILFSYFAFLGLGATVGIYFESFKKWLQKGSVATVIWVSWFSFGLFDTWLYYRANVYGLWFHSFWYEFAWSFYTLLSCFALFHISFLIIKWDQSIIRTWLTRLGTVTFAIYLLHPAVLFFWRLIPFSNQIFVYHAKVWLGMGMALGFTWFLVYLVRKYMPSLYWVLFGQGGPSKPQTSTNK